MIDTLIEVVVDNKRHENYQWTVDYADKMGKIFTGEGIETLMRQFVKREDAAMFKQRIDITQHITKSVAKNLMKPMAKVPRCNRSDRTIDYEDNPKRRDRFERILGKFWGDRSFDEWMNSRFIELGNIDPNAYVVLEWKPFKMTENASPYPFEVASKDVIYFEYNSHILDYLVVKLETKKKYKDRMHNHIRYTLYGKNSTFVLDEVFEPPNQVTRDNGDRFSVGGVEYVYINSKYFEIIIPTPHNLGRVPAFVTGYNRHLTRRDTYISGIDDAEPILMKMIKATSELDLTMALHAFPQKIQYVKRCNEELCSGGTLPDGTVCGTCKGEGIQPIKSAQEAILLEMPRIKEDMLDLSNMVMYISPSVELLKFQDKYVDNLTARCKQAVYNSEVFTRAEFTETATAKTIDYQNIYDALYPLARNFVNIWEWCVETIAKITDMDKGLIFSYFIPKDMQMKPLSELYVDLKNVNDARADSFIKQGVNDDIASYMYQDDSDKDLQYKTRQRFFPFSGKTREEIVILITTDLVTDFNKVLYANYGTILDDLDREYENFYKLVPNKQWGLIKAKVDGLLKELNINDYTESQEEDSGALQGE